MKIKIIEDKETKVSKPFLIFGIVFVAALVLAGMFLIPQTLEDNPNAPVLSSYQKCVQNSNPSGIYHDRWNNGKTYCDPLEAKEGIIWTNAASKSLP